MASVAKVEVGWQVQGRLHQGVFDSCQRTILHPETGSVEVSEPQVLLWQLLLTF